MRTGKLAKRLGLLHAIVAALGATATGCARIERWAYPPPRNAASLYETTQDGITALPPEVAADMAGGEEFFRNQEYSSATRMFHRVASDTTISPVAAEKARYFEAESHRLNGDLPEAIRTYNRLLQDFPAGSYRSDACGRMYEIANYWLTDLREELKQEEEKRRGERQFVMPAMFNFSKDKPFLDSEGHALKYLEELHYADPTGPYADKSLWLLGYVHFYRGNYADADLYLSQLIEHYPDSELRPEAVKFAIMAKNNATGGPDYDGKKSAEAIKLIHSARASVPELAGEGGEFLDRQLVTISHQQAMKDFNVAEFYRRTGHPGSAYFYYEIVKRRYPGTRFADLASARMDELRHTLARTGEPIIADSVEPASSGRIRVWEWIKGWTGPTETPGEDGGEKPNAQAGSESLPRPRPIPQEFLPN